MVLYHTKKKITHKFAVSSRCEHHHGLRSSKTELMTECCSAWRLFKSHWRKRVVQHCLTHPATAKANRDATSHPWRICVSLLREGTSWNWHSEASWVAPEERIGEGPKAQCIHCQVLFASQSDSWDWNERDKSAVCSQLSIQLIS